jgi:hypothetical protein
MRIKMIKQIDASLTLGEIFTEWDTNGRHHFTTFECKGHGELDCDLDNSVYNSVSGGPGDATQEQLTDYAMIWLAVNGDGPGKEGESREWTREELNAKLNEYGMDHLIGKLEN